MSKNIFVYVEAAEGKAKNVGLEILTPARVAADGGEVTAVVIGNGVEEAAKQAIAFGADKTVAVDDAQYATYNTDTYANALVELVKEYKPDAVFVGATPDGKDFAPVAAARLGAGCVANVTGVAVEDGKIVYTSPVYALSLTMQFAKATLNLLFFVQVLSRRLSPTNQRQEKLLLILSHVQQMQSEQRLLTL